MKLRADRFLLLLAVVSLVFWYFSIFYHETDQRSVLKKSDAQIRPTPTRLLYMAPSYNLNQFPSLQESLGTLVQLCNKGWNISIYLQVPSITNESLPLFTKLRESLYCSDFGVKIPLVIETFGDIGFGLNSRHRLVMKRLINDFDYFVYAEEDMILTKDIFFGFLHSQQLLRNSFPGNWIEYVPGLLRFELDQQTGERITWEYSPNKILVVKERGEYFVVTVNLNQAIFIFPREQILYLEQRCDFLSQLGNTVFYQELRKAMNKDWKGIAVGVSEWSSSFQHVLQCGLMRVVPVRFLRDSFIRHHTNKGSRRRSARDHIRVDDWPALLQQKITAGEVSSSVHGLYDEQVSWQYNVHLLARDRLRGRIKFMEWPQ